MTAAKTGAVVSPPFGLLERDSDVTATIAEAGIETIMATAITTKVIEATTVAVGIRDRIGIMTRTTTRMVDTVRRVTIRPAYRAPQV